MHAFTACWWGSRHCGVVATPGHEDFVLCAPASDPGRPALEPLGTSASFKLGFLGPRWRRMGTTKARYAPKLPAHYSKGRWLACARAAADSPDASAQGSFLHRDRGLPLHCRVVDYGTARLSGSRVNLPHAWPQSGDACTEGGDESAVRPAGGRKIQASRRHGTCHMSTKRAGSSGAAPRRPRRAAG